MLVVYNLGSIPQWVQATCTLALTIIGFLGYRLARRSFGVHADNLRHSLSQRESETLSKCIEAIKASMGAGRLVSSYTTKVANEFVHQGIDIGMVAKAMRVVAPGQGIKIDQWENEARRRFRSNQPKDKPEGPQ